MKITITIVVGLTLLGIGGFLGYSFGAKQVGEAVPQTALMEKVGELERASAVDSFCANLVGEIAEISEDSITLNREESLLEIKVDKDTQIYRLTAPKEKGEAPAREELTLKEIKKGEQVSVYGRLTGGDGLIAAGIAVLSR